MYTVIGLVFYYIFSEIMILNASLIGSGCKISSKVVKITLQTIYKACC
jgi:hypothetical protein